MSEPNYGVDDAGMPITRDNFATSIKLNPMIDEALGISVKHLSGVLEFDVHDIIAVADWVLTGTCDVAMKMSQQNMDNYRHIRDADAND